MAKNSTQIYSIFGQCDAAAARAMINEGKLTLIPISQIPTTALYNEAGLRAHFAVIVPREHQAEFDRRCSTMRA